MLLTHYPPALAPLSAEAQAGVSYGAIADLVRDLKPIAVVAGHEHRWAGRIEKAAWDGWETVLALPGPTGMSLCIEGNHVEFVYSAAVDFH